MKGKEPIIEQINPSEALNLFQYATTQEMEIVKSLYEEYKDELKTDFKHLLEIYDSKYIWDFLRFLTFIYDAGRVQGIREERQ